MHFHHILCCTLLTSVICFPLFYISFWIYEKNVNFDFYCVKWPDNKGAKSVRNMSPIIFKKLDLLEKLCSDYLHSKLKIPLCYSIISIWLLFNKLICNIKSQFKYISFKQKTIWIVQCDKHPRKNTQKRHDWSKVITVITKILGT